MYYRVREGPITANNSMTALTTLYGISTSASIQVPANSSAIVGIIVSVATDSASNGATTFGVQLSGDGLSQGQETLTVGAQGVDGTPASNGSVDLPFSLSVAIPVVGSNQISVAGAMSEDVGSAEMSVTLVFS